MKFPTRLCVVLCFLFRGSAHTLEQQIESKPPHMLCGGGDVCGDDAGLSFMHVGSIEKKTSSEPEEETHSGEMDLLQEAEEVGDRSTGMEEQQLRRSIEENPPVIAVNGLTVDLHTLKAVVKQLVDEALAKLPAPAPGPVGPMGPQGPNGSCDCTTTTTTLDPLTCNVAQSFQDQYGKFIGNGHFGHHKHNWAFSPQVVKRKTGKNISAGFQTIEDCSKLCSKVDGCLAWAWQTYVKVKGTTPSGSPFDWGPGGFSPGDNFCGFFFDDTAKCTAVCGNNQYWRETLWPSPGTCNGVCHRPAWSSTTFTKVGHYGKYYSDCAYMRK